METKACFSAFTREYLPLESAGQGVIDVRRPGEDWILLQGGRWPGPMKYSWGKVRIISACTSPYPSTHAPDSVNERCDRWARKQANGNAQELRIMTRLLCRLIGGSH